MRLLLASLRRIAFRLRALLGVVVQIVHCTYLAYSELELLIERGVQGARPATEHLVPQRRRFDPDGQRTAVASASR